MLGHFLGGTVKIVYLKKKKVQDAASKPKVCGPVKLQRFSKIDREDSFLFLTHPK